MLTESVFWVMNTSSTMSTNRPKISEDHSAAARVTVGAGGAGVLSIWDGTAGGTDCDGPAGVTLGSGDAYGSLLIGSSLPFPAQNQTTAPNDTVTLRR